MNSTSLISALLCCSVATVLLLKWRRRRRLMRMIEVVKWRRECVLKQMGDLVGKFKAQNPGHQPSLSVSLALPELYGKLRDGSLSPERVFYTYMDKTLKVTRDINFVSDYLEDSESQLQQVKNLGEKGLLYGVPVSIKDSITCKGHGSTLGLLKRLNQPAAADAVVVQVLKHHGTVPFVETNVPQFC